MKNWVWLIGIVSSIIFISARRLEAAEVLIRDQEKAVIKRRERKFNTIMSNMDIFKSNNPNILLLWSIKPKFEVPIMNYSFLTHKFKFTPEFIQITAKNVSVLDLELNNATGFYNANGFSDKEKKDLDDHMRRLAK